MRCPECGKEMGRYVHLETGEPVSWCCDDCEIEIDAMDLTDEELEAEEGAGG